MRYRPVFSGLRGRVLRQLVASQTEKLLARAQELATAPFLLPDLKRIDDEGREIGDILIDDFLFSYWADHAAKL